MTPSKKEFGAFFGNGSEYIFVSVLLTARKSMLSSAVKADESDTTRVNNRSNFFSYAKSPPQSQDAV